MRRRDLRKNRAWILPPLLLALVLGAALGTAILDRRRELSRAEALAESGDALAAMSLYAQLGDEENAARCRAEYLERQYRLGQSCLHAGDYLRAKDALLALGDYRDAKELIRSCDYLYAGQLAAEGEAEAAKALYESLADYPGAQERLRELTPLLYERANALADAFLLDDACRLFAGLDGYRDSAMLLRRAEAERRHAAGETGERICDPAKLFRNTEYYAVYEHALGYVLVPKETDRDARFFLYYPGGRNDELNIDFFLYYTMNPAPNTIALFLRTNGIPNEIAKRNAQAVEMLEQTAAECGVFLREMVVGGSSLGAYPALYSVIHTYYGHGIRVPAAFCLDAAYNWEEADLLPGRSQFVSLAKTGVALYLFDNPWVGMEHAAIRRMVDAGNNVTMVDCTYDEHERMTLDAMGMGVVESMLGDRTGPLHPEIYSFRRLSPEE